ncbi:hypothetical protein [Streptomyces sp. NPDC006668]|uniref:hypothetical protein n=1 Tax=Streptomyces sp. NPDC006668 TaxID=3156903 RepID=UPI0033F24830
MSTPISVDLTDGLDDSTNVTISIARSVLTKLNAADTWMGRDVEVTISGQEVESGKVTINIFEG